MLGAQRGPSRLLRARRPGVAQCDRMRRAEKAAQKQRDKDAAEIKAATEEKKRLRDAGRRNADALASAAKWVSSSESDAGWSSSWSENCRSTTIT